MSDGDDVSPAASVTLRSGTAGLVVTVAGLVGFVVLAIGVLALNGLNVVTGLVAATAGLSTIVILLDMPLRSTFDDRGVERSTPLRRHLIEWSEIDRLIRMRKGGIRRPGSDSFRGIVALSGRKRIVLVDRTETDDERERLLAVLRLALDDDDFAALAAPTKRRRSTTREAGADGPPDPATAGDDAG